MNQIIKSDEEFKLPEVAFKFVYQEARDPEYAEKLIESLCNEK